MNRHRPATSLVLAFLATLGLAGPAAAGDQVPFHGRLDGEVERTLIPPLVYVDVQGEGHATRLGRFTFDAPHEVNLATRTATGTYEFEAANGDTLTADFTGQSTPIPGTDILIIVETATITGGTGRFDDATGSFVVERLYYTGDDTTIGSFDGTISSTGAGKR